MKLEIWQIMSGGALLVLLFNQISLKEAFFSINFDIIIFLFCMFVIGVALEESGYLSHLSYKIFKRADNINKLLLFIIFLFAFLSSILMNDTIAIIGVPVVLLLARKHKIHAKILLLALAFSITIGSVMSPIGNPQNLLIAMNSNIKNPFYEFFKYLFFPTILNLFACFFILKIYYKEHFHRKKINHSQEPIKSHYLSILSKISLILIFLMILLKILLIFLKINFDFKLTYIALISCIPVLFSKERKKVLKKVDYKTLIFFISMFILMQSVWNSGFFQSFLEKTNINILSLFMIFVVGIFLSQFISNVPLVALYLPLLLHEGATTKEIIALAASSTIAGNLFILGAASNVIIIQNAEQRTRGEEKITSWDFAKIGIPLTIINALIYFLYLKIF